MRDYSRYYIHQRLAVRSRVGTVSQVLYQESAQYAPHRLPPPSLALLSRHARGFSLSHQHAMNTQGCCHWSVATTSQSHYHLIPIHSQLLLCLSCTLCARFSLLGYPEHHDVPHSYSRHLLSSTCQP